MDLMPGFQKNWTFKDNFLSKESSESSESFLSFENISLGKHFLLLTFFDNTNYVLHILFPKTIPIFCRLTKYNNFIRVYSVLA